MGKIKRESGKVILTTMLSLSLAIVGFGKNLTINKIGETGQRIYLDACLNGNYAYCAASSDGVDIFSIIDPANPVKVGNIAAPGGAASIAVKGNYAYIAGCDEMGMVNMQVVDITDMNTPVWVGHCFSNIGSSQPLFIRVVDNYAYLAGSYSVDGGGMAIIDISTPSSPFIVGQYHVINAIGDLVIDGHYAYLSTVDYDGYLGFLETYLHIIDITNPASPFLIGHYDGIGKFKDLQISGKYLYIAGLDYEDPSDSSSDYYYYLLILDVSRGRSPKKVGKIRLSSRVDTIGLRPDNKYAYLTSGSFDGGMSVVDISRPSSPVEVNRIAGICAEEIVIKDDYIYAVNQEEGLKIYDISNAVTPTLSWETAASSLWSTDLAAVNGNYAYVFDSDDNMYIYDISDPTHPVEKRIHHIGAYTRDIKFSGNYAYLALGFSGLIVMDISNPTNPVVVGNCPVSNAWGVYVNGNYAYIAGDMSGLLISRTIKP